MKGGFSRRAVVKAGVALGAATFLSNRAFASGALRLRYDVASPEGAAMLAKYAEAVKRLSLRATGDPTSWTFLWFTHRVRSDSDKASEIAKLPPEARALAGEVWNTCQAHGEEGIEDCFLPWHRIYLYYFERIVRAALNDATFTMPYWNYTALASRALPAAFREPADASNPLYRAHRKPKVNAGHAIDEGQNAPSPLNLGCLDQSAYSASQGVKQGFCLSLDQNLHAAVHILVGDRQGMGDIKWAANDPIFWLHHSNVDRLWASWIARGNDNPDDDSWRNRQFIFADENGARVVTRTGDFTDIAALGYAYDRLEGVAVAIAEKKRAKVSERVGAAAPGGAPSEAAAPPPPFITSPITNLVASAAGPVAIGAAPVQVALNVPLLAAPGGAAPFAAAPPMEAAPPPEGARHAAKPKAAAAPPHLYLVIRNLQARAQPGVLYDVYLDVGSGASKKSVRLGTINFFDAGMAGMMSQKFVSFDVTGIVDGNLSPKEIGVTVAPVGEPAANAKPVIGDITLASA